LPLRMTRYAESHKTTVQIMFIGPTLLY